MKPIHLLAVLSSLLILASCHKANRKSGETPSSKAAASGTQVEDLLADRSLGNWEHLLVDKSLGKADVWRVDENGVLICKGQPLGYLHTRKAYQDFKLSLEWRWAPGTEPTNSGVLLRIAAPPESFLPKCIEAQLQHGKAGDLYGFFGANINAEGDRLKIIESAKIGTFKAVPRTGGTEKPAGEWNHYEITVKGDTVELKINGEVVNKAHGLDVIAGPIGLQSEGSEIHFRNIRLGPAH
jgi:hypothetical protein